MSDNKPIVYPEGLDEAIAALDGVKPQVAAPSAPASDPTSLAGAPPPPGLDEAIGEELKEEKYGTAGQMLKTAAEGAASAATFGLSTGIEKSFAEKEDIRERREANPISHMVGQAAGLIGSAFLLPEVGAAAGLAKAGAMGAKAVGLGAATTTMQKIGSAAVKGAIENALVQAGDENSKMLAAEDGKFSETALVNIGLAGLIGGGIGGAIGTVHPLWEAAEGSKVGRVLKAITDKAGGVESAVPEAPIAGKMTPKQAVDHLIETSGMEIDPVVKMGLSGDPEIQSWVSGLNQTDTTASGKAVQASIKKFREDAGAGMARALGKEIDQIPIKGEIDKYTTGKELAESLAQEYHAQVDPLAKAYEAKKARFGKEQLTPDTVIENAPDYSNPYAPSSGVSIREPGTVSQIMEKITQKMHEESWDKILDSDISKEVHKVLKALPEQKTLNDLSSLAEAVGQQMQKDRLTNGPLFRAGGIIKGILRDAEADVIAQRLGKEAPEALAEFAALRKAYGKQAALKEALDSRLHAKGSTAGYAKSLREMGHTDGEKVLRNLSGINDAELIDILKTNFPKTADLVKNHHIKSILASAKDGEMIRGERLVRALTDGKLSPQLREFITTPEAMTRINAISQMLEKLNNMPHNFSNMARTLDKLFQYIPGSAISMVSLLQGNNPIMSTIAGSLIKPLGKDLPDAIKLGLLKFMGSDKPISAGAFKATVDTIQSVIKGEAALNKAVKSVFATSGSLVSENPIPMPKAKDLQKLDKQLKKFQTNPDELFKVASDNKASTYLPNQAANIGLIAGRAVQYLNSLRPNTTPANPLDSEPVPSPVEKASYNNALAIAAKPLLIVDKIKSGTLTADDMKHFAALYPGLHNKIADKLVAEIADIKGKGKLIPYKARMSLSLFMAQPLDSTMTPNSILSAQPKPTQQPQQAQGNGDKVTQKGGQALSKLSKSYQTPGQSAEQDRSDRQG